MKTGSTNSANKVLQGTWGIAPFRKFLQDFKHHLILNVQCLPQAPEHNVGHSVVCGSWLRFLLGFVIAVRDLCFFKTERACVSYLDFVLFSGCDVLWGSAVGVLLCVSAIVSNNHIHPSWGFAFFPTLSTDWQIISFSKVIVPQQGDVNVVMLVAR